MQQLHTYKGFASDYRVSSRRLNQVRREWLQWLLFDQSQRAASRPAWSFQFLLDFAQINNPHANHFRSRLCAKLTEKQLVEAALWYHGVPGLAWRICQALLIDAINASGIDLALCWRTDRCGPLTSNYINIWTKEIELTDSLPEALKPWWNHAKTTAVAG
jgi:hypothetical protein